MPTRVSALKTSALNALAERLRTADFPLAADWETVNDWFGRWAALPELRAELKNHLHTLAPAEAAALIKASRETTTHFAWCLLDSPDDEFSFWLHEYKPQRDWRQGYADSVHNHRYHFCTTLLRGHYLHERYHAHLDPDTGLITSVRLRSQTQCATGSSGRLLADEFHRIPSAGTGTMTFLVKSRAVTESSVSFDPATGIGHRHVPVEVRLGELADRI
jgi:hypothetical protein